MRITESNLTTASFSSKYVQIAQHSLNIYETGKHKLKHAKNNMENNKSGVYNNNLKY